MAFGVETVAPLVKAAIQGAATGGATRQGMAAAVAAALRTGIALLMESDSPDAESRSTVLEGEQHFFGKVAKTIGFSNTLMPKFILVCRPSAF